jgi:hypothetical protein
MNKKVLSILTLIVLVSGAISFCLLTRGHSWLDDFAAYIMQAKSILDGTMGEFVRRNAFTVSASSYPPGPAAYPWGFPLLLAPVYAVFGLNALVFKLVNILFYALFLIVLFALARTRLTDVESLLLTAALAFNPALLLAHDQIISDIPFLFFCTLSIYLAEKFSVGQMSFPCGDAMRAGLWRSNLPFNDVLPSSEDCHAAEEQERRLAMTSLPGIATGAAIFAASFIRTNGILLLIPLALTQLIQLWPQRRNLFPALKSASIPYLTFGVLFTAQALIFPNRQDSYLSHFSMFSLQGLWDNFLYYLWLPSWMFREIPFGAALYPLLLVFVIVSIIHTLRARWRRSRDLPIHAFSLATVAVFILWPERQGLRFIYPVLPFLLLFAFDGMKLAAAHLQTGWRKPAGRVLTGFWLLLIVVSFGVSFNAARDNLSADRAINGPFDPVSAGMFAFVREKTPAESVVIFFKPRALRLFTDRDAFMTERCADLPKGDYLALSEKVGDNGQIAPEKIASCAGVKLDEVFNNRRFTVYKINK